MLIGINLTSHKSLPFVKKLLSSGEADFCEILIDNFLHLPPESIQEVVETTPVAFHIMQSRFLERKPENVKFIGKHIRKWIKALHPLYVSDHLALFTNGGRRLPLLVELDYETKYSHTKDRVEEWQEILQHRIAFENFPSTLDYDAKQVKFYDQLIDETECGLLFDISNMIISELNCGVSPSLWMELAYKTQWFHAGGFRMSDTTPSVAIDTHDVPLADVTFEYIKQIIQEHKNSEKGTLVIERDSNISYESWKNEILTVKKFDVKS